MTFECRNCKEFYLKVYIEKDLGLWKCDRCFCFNNAFKDKAAPEEEIKNFPIGNTIKEKRLGYSLRNLMIAHDTLKDTNKEQDELIKEAIWLFDNTPCFPHNDKELKHAKEHRKRREAFIALAKQTGEKQCDTTS